MDRFDDKHELPIPRETVSEEESGHAHSYQIASRSDLLRGTGVMKYHEVAVCKGVPGGLMPKCPPEKSYHETDRV